MLTIKIKEKDGSTTEYVRDQFGVIKQLYPKPFVYDPAYCATYDTPDYERKSLALQRLRLGFVEACSPGPVKSLLDCGYGNGAFLKNLFESRTDLLSIKGYDISGVPVPLGCEKVKELPLRTTHGRLQNVDVITFWDCLEHFPDLSFIANLSTNMIVVSLPWCHFNYYLMRDAIIEPHVIGSVAAGWFTSWHHRKPNEHLFHFDKDSLKATLWSLGWKCIATTSIEDVVRKGKHAGLPNILTAAFVRR